MNERAHNQQDLDLHGALHSFPNQAGGDSNQPTTSRLKAARVSRDAGRTAVTPQIFTKLDTQICLFDRRRVAHFRQALYETVKPGDVVVDGGSGTGILGMLAAQAGAARVYCVELDEEYVDVIAHNAKNNGMESQVVPIYADAITTDLPEPVDVIVAEVISGGFFNEPQIQIVNNLRRFLKPGGSVVPAAISNYVELTSAQEELYGFEFRYDSRYKELDDASLTTKAAYLTTNFLDQVPVAVDSRAVVRSMVDGEANALRVSYSIQLSPGTLATEPTEFLLNPETIFLDKRLRVKAGDYYVVSLAYTAGASPLSAVIDIEPLAN